MHLGKRPILILVFLASLAASASAQTGGDNPGIPGGQAPADDAAGETGAQYKFDDGFYQKIQNLILDESQKIPDPAPGAPRGDSEIHDGERHYNVIIVVSRDDGDGRDPDQTARENKDSIVEYLGQLGARDILAAESLSFVTASIPVSEIPGLSSRDEIYKMGDGELLVTLEIDTARRTIHATPSDLNSTIGWVPNGTGVTVAVIDSGINNTYLNDKVAERAYCNYRDGCREQPDGIITGSNEAGSASHGTRVAQVIAASGMPAHNGIAQGVTLLDAMYASHTMHRIRPLFFHVMYALDWSYSRGADVVNISLGQWHCSTSTVSTYNMIINEAVDKGMVVAKSAGNEGRTGYNTITNPGCAHNVIVAGGIIGHAETIATYAFSSKGPTTDLEPRLVPHIVAPARDIFVLRHSIGSETRTSQGTSLAAPQVTAAAAMILQVQPALDPAGVRAALLLGANWQGPVPCTSLMYEQNDTDDGCSYARQPSNRNDAASLEILNNVGFGILDVAESLRYAAPNASHIVSGYLDSETASRQYQFEVLETAGTAKVILTWMVGPDGELTGQGIRNAAEDIDLAVVLPNGTMIDAGSVHQTSEFAVFETPMAGNYTVMVTGSDFAHGTNQTFALASTFHFTVPNRDPALETIDDIIVDEGQPVRIRPGATDANNNTLTFSLERGTLPAAAMFDTTNGHLDWNTTESDGGSTHDITITVSDGRGGSDMHDITITVIETNQDPAFVAPAVPPGQVGVLYTLDLAAIDADRPEQTLSYEIASHNATGAEPAIDTATGTITWTPSVSEIVSITVRVSDDQMPAGTADITLVIPVPNTPPSAPDDTLTIQEDSGATTIMPAIMDSEPGLRITQVAGATRGNVTTDGTTITYTPNTDEHGGDTITYTVRDSDSVEVTGTITITITPVNDAPVLAAPAIGPVSEMVEFVTTLEATDIDNSTAELTFGVQNAPDGLAVSGDRLTWTPTEAQGSQTLTFTVTVSDDIDTDSQEVTVTVTETNQNPTLIIVRPDQLPPARIGEEYNHISFEVTDADTPTQTLSYDVSSNATGDRPEIAIIKGDDPIIGISVNIGWTPDVSEIVSITAAVSDDQEPAGTASETIVITVPNPPPTTSDEAATTPEDTAATITPDIMDDGTFTITAVTNGTRGTATTNGTAITYTPNENANGADMITYTVQDDDGATVTGRTTITITPVNDAPALEPIDDITVDEGEPVEIRPAATDVDNDDATLTFSLSGDRLPAAATFDETTGALDWNTTETDGGTLYDIAITASDGQLDSDPEAITITVTETNQDPVLDNIGDITVQVDTEGTFTATATDADIPEQTLTYSIADAPAGATIDGQTGVFRWTPDTLESRTVNVTVSDGQGGSDSQNVTITVSDQPPPEAPDESRTVQEDSTDNFITPAIMDDGTFTITAVTNGTRGTATTNGTAITYTPNANVNGTDTITYTVTDDDDATDTGTITITIAPVNDAPALEPIDDITVDEGEPVEIRPAAADVDNDDATLTFSLSGDGLPAAATFDETNGYLDWTTAESDGGTSYMINITVSDGDGGSDSEVIAITVTETNQNPVFDSTIITEQSATLGEPFALDVTAADADVPAQTVSYEISSHNSTGTPPAIDPATGTITWTPNTVQTVSITVRASDSFMTAGTTDIEITVTVAPPANTAPAARDFSVEAFPSETASVNLTEAGHISDAEQDASTLTVILNTTFGTHGTAFTDDDTFVYFASSGSTGVDVFQYTVEDDGGLTDTAVITVTVTEPGTTEPNQAPEFDDIVTEHEAVLGEQFTLEVTATDADVPAQTITYAIESQNATGTPPAIDQATGMITWMPDTIETVLITVRASDNFTTPGMTDINLTVTVSAPPANTAPTTRDFAVEVATSETISVNLTEAGHISDAEQDTSTLTVSLNTNVGTHGTASINGDTFAYNATSGGTGVDTFEYTVEDDGGLTASATITVTVTEPNQNPVFDSTIITNRGAAIGEQITLAVTATDPDGPAQTITYQIVSHDATGAEPAIDQNTGTITWTPDTAETVSITVRASDDQTPAGTADITINVRVDEIVAIADRATTNGIDTLHIHATANDAPSDARIVNVNLGVLGFIQNLGTITHNDTHITYEPSEADRFRLDGSFIPPFQYTLQSQDGALRVQALVYITFEHLEAVDDAASTESNMPVVIDVLANDIHRDFTVVTATDPENGSVEVSAADGVITYTPDTDYAGQDTFDYTIRDTSSDSTDTATVTIEVVGNAAPMLDTIPSHNFAEGVNGTLDVTAQDPTRPDGDLMWSLQGEPAGMTITSTGPTTAQIQWMPTEAQGDGTPIRINVTVTDSEFTDSQAVTVRALEVNQDPVLDNIGPMSVQVDDEITFTASAIDGDIPAQTLTYSIANAPTGATMTSDGMFSWTPGAADINAHTFTVTVSDGEGSDSQEVTITVTDQPPPTASDESRTISEDSEAITITPDIMDDGTANITAITVQPTLGTATHNETTITYTPNADAHGNDTITYTVTDDDGASNPGTITITITSVNDPPVFDSAIVTNQSAAVGEQFTLDVTATDVDLPAQTITYEIASHDATGTAPTIDTTTGTISWTPDTAEIVSIIVRALDDQTPADTANITITVTVSQTPTEPTLRAPDIDVEAVPSLLASARPDIGAGATITSATGATMGTITEGFLSQGTIAYTAAANASGIDEVTYTVSDGADGTAQGTIYFYINAQGNERPVLDAIPGIQTDGTSIFQAMATDDDDDTLTYVIRNAPEGATINSTAGAFSWNATDSNPGDYIFNVVVHDDSGGLALQKMVVTVRDPNNGSPTAPVVHRSTTLGTSVLIAPDIRDPEGQPTGMILAVGAEKGTIREGFLEANIIAYVPTEEGTDIISYTTSDGAGGATTSTVYVHTGTSEDPDLEAIGVQRVNTTEILEFQTPISDEDSSDISYVMSGAPDGATLDESTGGFSWTPAASDVGDHAFTITAYDGQGGFDTEHVAISVSDPNVTNHDPDISDLDFAARQNNPRFIALQTSDPDGDPTDIILATNTTAGAILQDSLRFGIVAYVPDIDRVGTDTVTYVISDGRGGASTGTIYVHIRDPNNDEPTLESVGIKQVGVPNELTFNVTATDNDEGDVLTFGIRNAPAGATINSTTGAFSWTPTASDMGDHAFTVVVRDDAGGFATERIIITVTDPTSPNQPPTASDESDTTAGERIVVFVDVTDPDGDDLTIIAATGATQGLVDEDLFDDTIIAYTPLEGAFGTETITYTVSDGHGGLATGTITITIG